MNDHPATIRFKGRDLLLVALTVIVPRVVGLMTLNLFDDAYITFRHVTNLVAGHGYVFNPGTAVLGTTSPLFGLLLAPLAFLGIPPPVTAVGLGIAADIAVAYIAYRILAREVSAAAAALFVVVFAIDPSLIRIGVGGMESGVFVLGTFLWALLVVSGRGGPAVVLSAVLVFIRPEALGLGLLSLLAILRAGRLGKAALLWPLGAAAILALGALALKGYYGTPIPQSVASKGRDVGGSLLEVVRIFFFPKNNAYPQWALTVLAPFGIRTIWRRSQLFRWLLAWTGLYVLAFLASRPLMWTWYAMPVYTMKAVLAGSALAELAVRLNLDRWVTRTAAPLALGVLGAGFLALTGGRSPVQTRVYDPMKAWCRANVSAGQTVAAGDVGVIGYYSPAFVYDLAGLVWPDRWKYPSARQAILQTKPDFVMVEVTGGWREFFVPTSEVRALYQPRARFSRFGESSLTPDPAKLPSGWRQDYVVFGRVPGTRQENLPTAEGPR